MSKEKQIEEMISVLHEGMKPLKETYGTEEIANILYAAGYRKQGKIVTCQNCIHRHPFGPKCILDGVVHDDDYFCRDAKGETKEK